MSQILFFALKADLLIVIDDVEANGGLDYIKTGSFLSGDLETYSSARDLPRLGQATAESAVVSDAFLVVPHGAEIVVRRAGQYFLVDQLANPDSIVLTPSGLYAPHILLHGRAATVSSGPTAKALLGRFSRAVKRHFTKVKAFYVGREAQRMLDAGDRLTSAVQAPREFDLRR